MKFNTFPPPHRAQAEKPPSVPIRSLQAVPTCYGGTLRFLFRLNRSTACRQPPPFSRPERPNPLMPGYELLESCGSDSLGRSRKGRSPAPGTFHGNPTPAAAHTLRLQMGRPKVASLVKTESSFSVLAFKGQRYGMVGAEDLFTPPRYYICKRSV